MAEGNHLGLGITPVAVDRNWQHRVHNEIESSKKWEEKWGFLSGGGQFKDSVDQFITTNNKACTSTVSLNLRDTTRRNREASHDSVDGFLHQFMVKAGGPSMRALPKQEFQRPTLSSHALGWGNNLERFGPLKLHMR